MDITDQIPSVTLERKIEFLRHVPETAEKRRDSVENKSSILLASNAILLTAMASLGLPTLVANNMLTWIKVGLAIIFLVSVAVSSLYAIGVLGRPPQRLRQVNIPASGFNLLFFGKIAEFKNADTYLATIESLTDQQILEQLTTQAHNLSSILSNRYNWFELSHRAFILGILAFIILTLTRVLG